MISVQQSKKLLGKTGEKMIDKEIEKIRNILYSVISQIIDNNLEKIQQCKKQ